jgi:hypothetical protein
VIWLVMAFAVVGLGTALAGAVLMTVTMWRQGYFLELWHDAFGRQERP